MPAQLWQSVFAHGRIGRAAKGESTISKYDPLWNYIQNSGKSTVQLTFEEIRAVTGFPVDHAFLRYKKELAEYGYQVGKISMKEQTVIFSRLDG